MPLKAVLNSDELTDELKPLYVEKDGKFVLDVIPVGGFAMENVEGLKGVAGKERKRATEAEAKLARYGDLDPDKARDWEKKIAEMANWTPEEKVKEQIEAKTKGVIEKAQAELAKERSEKDTYFSELKRVKVTQAALQALTEAGALSTRALLPHVESRIKIRVADGGQILTEVVDENGNPAFGDSHGNPMSITQLVSELKQSDDFAPLFKGTEQRGTGAAARPSGGGGSTKTITTQQLNEGGYDLEKIASGEIKVID